MTTRTDYHRDTGVLSVSLIHKHSDLITAWCSSHNTGWEMQVEDWIKVVADIQRAIDRVQLQSNTAQVAEPTAELAAMIEQHGAAT